MQKSYSFIIPSYNDAAGLKRNLEYFSRTDKDVQVIIVDDCSTDNTAEVIQSFDGPKNVELVYHRQARNQGPGAARNKGVELANRRYLMFLDADDILAECFFDYIEMSSIEDEADFIVFKYHLALTPEDRYTYEMHKVDAACFSRIENSHFPTGTVSLAEMTDPISMVAFPWNKLYKREFYVKSRIQFPDERMHEDISPHWESFLRCRRFSMLSWAPPLITHYELFDGSRATNYIGEQRLKVFRLLGKISAEIDQHPAAELIQPAFKSFYNDLFRWMTNVLCAGNSEQAKVWRKKYQKSINEFLEAIEETNAPRERRRVLEIFGGQR